MTDSNALGIDAIKTKGWFAAHKWLLIRRGVQLGILGLFLAGPMAGIWIVKGNLTSSLTLGILPLTDPFVLLQTFAAGNIAGTTALLGAAIVTIFYAIVGGRTYCSFVCPVNIVTDAAHWLSARLALPKGWQPARKTRLWLLAAVMGTAAVTGIAAWEMLNPVTLVHRGLVFGMGFLWIIVLALFLFDLVISRRGWCGKLCPQGAFYGLLGSFSLIRVSAKNRDDCNDCMECYAVCPEPHVIQPALHGTPGTAGPVVLSRDCTNCGRCIDICSKNVFVFDHRFNNPVTPVGHHAGNMDSHTRRAA